MRRHVLPLLLLLCVSCEALRPDWVGFWGSASQSETDGSISPMHPFSGSGTGGSVGGFAAKRIGPEPAPLANTVGLDAPEIREFVGSEVRRALGPLVTRDELLQMLQKHDEEEANTYHAPSGYWDEWGTETTGGTLLVTILTAATVLWRRTRNGGQ